MNTGLRVVLGLRLQGEGYRNLGLWVQSRRYRVKGQGVPFWRLFRLPSWLRRSPAYSEDLILKGTQHLTLAARECSGQRFRAHSPL